MMISPAVTGISPIRQVWRHSATLSRRSEIHTADSLVPIARTPLPEDTGI